MNIKYKILEANLHFKWKYQRFQRGYADVDYWNIDSWFLNNITPMIKDLRLNHHGYPRGMTDDEWTHILLTMEKSFEIGNSKVEDNPYWEQYSNILIKYDINTPEENYQPNERAIQARYWEFEKIRIDIARKARQNGLRLFSKYFEDLWD